MAQDSVVPATGSNPNLDSVLVEGTAPSEITMHPVVAGILQAAATYNIAFPIVADLIIGVLNFLRKSQSDAPLPTDEEAFAMLRNHALSKRAEEDAWLASKGQA